LTNQPSAPTAYCMQPCFPFSALVGQEALKRALRLGVIQPALGGVLIRGTKGLGKSTAVRALAHLLPPIETVAGCPFQRRPGEEIPCWPLPPEAPIVRRPAPLVELPLGATEDRILGSLHWERALRGERCLEPGLLAAANRGILYIDEVNLLPDPLVDLLLDAAASGVHRLEREGLSLSHPARFLLVGTMNPEEGELRPQLLDRFGLVVDLSDLSDPQERQEAVRRRLAYEADPQAFVAAWRAAEEEEARRLVAAQERLPRVQLPEPILRLVSQRCLEAGVEGLRADLTICRAAQAWAAYQGHEEVTPEDVEAVAELALTHRRRPPRQPPPGPAGRPTTTISPPSDGHKARAGAPPASASASPQGNAAGGSYQTFASAGLMPADLSWLEEGAGAASRRGRTRAPAAAGGAAGPVRRYAPGLCFSWAATLRAALARQVPASGPLSWPPRAWQEDDLRGRPRQAPCQPLLLLLLDSSGSMAAWQRMQQVKALTAALLHWACVRRQRVALLAFHGEGVALLLPPRRPSRRARQLLEEFPTGGPTPLADALASAEHLLRREQRRSRAAPQVILLTDGRANRACSTGPVWEQTLAAARRLAALPARFIVIDTETGPCRLARAVHLAQALQAPCLSLDVVLPPTPDVRRRAG
jgi:magnesium chelatase subunit D